MADTEDTLWGEDKSELIDRVHELEGLLASTTRRLEASQRDAATLRDELDDLPTTELVIGEPPAHLARLDEAIARLAIDLATGGSESDLWMHTDTSEPRLAILAAAIQSLAIARERLTPKPFPPIR